MFELIPAASKSCFYYILHRDGRPLPVYVADYSGACSSEHKQYAICGLHPRSDDFWWQMIEQDILPIGTSLAVAEEKAIAYATSIGCAEVSA